MNRVLRLALFSLALSHPEIALSQTPSPTITYEGFRNVRTDGDDTTWARGLTHRYVQGELRFLTLAHSGHMQEFRIADVALNSAAPITQTTATWDIGPTGVLNDLIGYWYEQDKARLWVVSATDYTVEERLARVTLLTLGANGSVSVSKRFVLNVAEKRVYGGCLRVPAALAPRLGGPYVCGWGGYTSLVAQGGGASIGPTMYAIPDPDTIAEGQRVNARTVLDAADTRGVRKSIPENYFDGGGSGFAEGRPDRPPLRSGNWLSPNRDGLGWMVWGDSYYNTGMWVGTTYLAVASLCQGKCWYQGSTLRADGRQFELHTWDGASLGKNTAQRPTTITTLDLPRGELWFPAGNSATGNISGATYDPTSGRVYMIGYPLGGDNVGRLYSFIVETRESRDRAMADNVAVSSASTTPRPEAN